jgi:lysophospholipase L1-like esterase
VNETARAASVGRFFSMVGVWLVVFTLVAILAEVFSYTALYAYGRFHHDPLRPEKSPAYNGEKWGNEFWTEQASFWSRARSSYLPFTVWSVRQWHGKYINTDVTEMGKWRRTTQAMSEGCSKASTRRVWVFGGSTVYGIGTPDSATIPSYLSRELNADPSACVDVTNLGAEGYVTNQDVILLLQQLKAGLRPDIAIFYDGVNESLVGGFSPGIPTAHWNFDMIKAKFENPGTSKLGCLNLSYSSQLIRLLMENYGRRDHAAISDGELAAKAQATLQNYEANLKVAQILAQGYGFKVYFFWQPVLAYGEKPLVPFERKLREARSEELEGRVYRGLRAVYSQAESRSAASGTFVFLGHAFDNVKEPLYVDEFHLDPRGNELIAHIIAHAVRPGATSE